MFSRRSVFTRDLSSHRLYDDVALTDIEGQSLQRARTTDQLLSMQATRSHSSSLTLGNMLRKNDPAVEEVSSKFHNTNTPLLVPSFSSLRRTLVEQLNKSLQRLERDIAAERSSEKVAEAVSLLQQMDYVIESEIKLSRLGDPTHADSQGLSVIHFELQDRTQSQLQSHAQPWLMITHKWGLENSTIVEPMDNVRLKQILPEDHLNELKRRGGTDDIMNLHPWKIRKKTASEERRWTLQYLPNGSIMYRPRIRTIWRAAIVIAIASLIIFYGVGIIATSTTFDEVFKRYFFWIAIFWSLISSSLLSWVTVAFGASRRDAVGAFLTGIGIWLVVIQIGQTHLLTQLQSSQGET
ncbi:hypothetical protein OPT61_g2021 [Boeremia exigua]|uniref:Uncharacterized protein n=1 Tax=Boeremia exigua TaxID=749465 RepID=A0ACC2IN04_9PLEO|nr:hypothetical protein OPT61_g2021 [Boeremia exigua]